jgi:hypothetical protein
MSDPCFNTNTTLGCKNFIDDNNVRASLVEGFANTIESGTGHHVEGSRNLIDLFPDTIGPTNNTHIEGSFNKGSGEQNHIEGSDNRIGNTGGTGPIVHTINSHIEGLGNVINGSQSHAEGEGNIINSENLSQEIMSQNCHVEGLSSTVAGFQNHVEGCNHKVNGFQSHVAGCNNRTINNRAGQHLTGYGGYFLTDQSKTFNEDIYNYSNQLGGGLNDPGQNPGEGISMIDRTLINGVYPIGQHQAYRNTSDGLSYSIILKGEKGLKEGTFVTFGDLRCDERLITEAGCGDEIVGVITNSSGFIANAGQFAASTRIKYDQFHNPLIKINKSSSKNVTTKTHHQLIDNKSNLTYPPYETIIKDSVDRSIPFVPYTERKGYYQVALSGLVVVRARNANHFGSKCGVKDGIAVKGRDFWVVKIIDNDHVMILLK